MIDLDKKNQLVVWRREVRCWWHVISGPHLTNWATVNAVIIYWCCFAVGRVSVGQETGDGSGNCQRHCSSRTNCSPAVYRQIPRYLQGMSWVDQSQQVWRWLNHLAGIHTSFYNNNNDDPWPPQSPFGWGLISKFYSPQTDTGYARRSIKETNVETATDQFKSSAMLPMW